MKLKPLYKLAVTVIALLTTGFSNADNGKPDLWKVEKNGVTSYLFGSIHIGSENMYPLSSIVTNAYTNADHLAVEIDLKPGEEMKMVPLVQKYGLDLTKPIEQRLSPEGLVIYQKACKERALPCAQFAPFRGWLLSAQLTVLQMQKLGYKEELGIDKHFLNMAHKANKSVISLESAQMQFELLGGLDQETQEIMLIQSLQATTEDIEALFAAWQTGDDKAMLEMFQQGADNPKIKAMYLKLFDKRNIKMAKKIDHNASAKKSLFVVVGAGHIIGKNGLVDLLTKDGFKATQLQ
ncbi:MAG: TraB/GumN family protein [Kangiellaceae bacterium]|nr:TraB/GumN family protein [Kangiellaceae bacterium]